MDERILNVYEFKSNKSKQSYIYSVRKEEDNLGYKYYILTENNNNEKIIYEADNTLNILQSNNIELTPIKKDTQKYKDFLIKLLSVLNKNIKKEEVLNRK